MVYGYRTSPPAYVAYVRQPYAVVNSIPTVRDYELGLWPSCEMSKLWRQIGQEYISLHTPSTGHNK